MARRKKSKPLTPSQKQLEKDVKRINERINEIAKLLGTESYAYDQWYSALKLAIPEKYRRISEKGLIQIARSKDYYETSRQKKTKQAIQRLLGMKTAGQLKKEAKSTLKAEGVKGYSAEDLTERIKTIDVVNTFVSEHEDMFYLPKKAKAYNTIHIKGRKKTYKELQEIIDSYNEELKKGTLTTDVFAGLEG